MSTEMRTALRAAAAFIALPAIVLAFIAEKIDDVAERFHD